jgi:hypothetical protein
MHPTPFNRKWLAHWAAWSTFTAAGSFTLFYWWMAHYREYSKLKGDEYLLYLKYILLFQLVAWLFFSIAFLPKRFWPVIFTPFGLLIPNSIMTVASVLAIGSNSNFRIDLLFFTIISTVSSILLALYFRSKATQKKPDQRSSTLVTKP